MRPLFCAPWIAIALACGGPNASAPPAATSPVDEGDEVVDAPVCTVGDDESVDALRARLAALPECSTLRIALGSRLAADGSCDEAEAELDPLMADEAAARRAFVRLAAGSCGDRRRVGLAEAICEAMLADEPSAATWIACGRLQESVGETAGAMEHYRRARELDPSGVEAIEAAALALRFRDFPVAARHYEALTAVAPDRVGGWRGLAHARRGIGDLEGAIAAMERAVELDGAAPEPRYHLALWLRESGAYEPAVVQLRAFLVVAADRPAFASARERARETLERWRREL
ncbi:MAG: tetratricopeptide repeat protein [Deltaproteobacteria bacterium]|nr:tetratricopeptide repeat protein [Deltaproteobacteria bacterium]